MDFCLYTLDIRKMRVHVLYSSLACLMCSLISKRMSVVAHTLRSIFLLTSIGFSNRTSCFPFSLPVCQVQWLLDNYETAEGVSLPRSTLYCHYLLHCQEQKLEAVNAASFGKLIRSVFMGLRTRRLGTR